MTTANETTTPIPEVSAGVASRQVPGPMPPVGRGVFSLACIERFRSNRLLRSGSPWLASCVFHGGLVVVLGLVLWRLGDKVPVPHPPAVLSFADPSLGEVGEKAEERSRRSAASASTHTPATDARSDAATVDAGVRSTMFTDAGYLALLGAAPSGMSRRGNLAAVNAASLDLGIGDGRQRAAMASGSDNDRSDLRVASTSPASATSVTFAGLGSSGARSVVYVVDASGPMVGTLRDVIAEIERSVARLAPSQKFGVVIFRDPGRVTDEAGQVGAGSPTESFMPVLIRATPDAQARLSAWLAAIEPKGRSNPLDGLRAGLALKSEAVFLLSRSIERTGGGVWQLGLDATMQELDRLNPLDPTGAYRSVTIKTIQFLEEDPTGIMQAIGQRHGGGDNNTGYTVIRRGKDLE